MIRSRFLWPLLCLCAVTSSSIAAGEVGRGDGLIVCIGEKALDRVSGDWNKPGCTFHCLETFDARVDAVRRKMAAAGCHGKVSAAKFDGRHLPYINNLVSRIIVASKRCAVPSEEIHRALARNRWPPARRPPTPPKSSGSRQVGSHSFAGN